MFGGRQDALVAAAEEGSLLRPREPVPVPVGGRHGGTDHLGTAHGHSVQGESCGLPLTEGEPLGPGSNALSPVSLRTPAAASASPSLEATTPTADPWSCPTLCPEARPWAGSSETRNAMGAVGGSIRARNTPHPTPAPAAIPNTSRSQRQGRAPGQDGRELEQKDC